MIAQNSIVQNKWAKSPYCKLLLHMNGVNDGTVFYDESPSPKTVTAIGNTCTKTANTPSSSNPTTALQIGFSFTGYYMYGYIDELAIWNSLEIPITDLYPARAPLYDYAISEWSGQ